MAKAKEEKEKKASGSIYLSADYILEKETKVIRVSPCIDQILGGGWSDGTIGILESMPKVGKTTLALKIGAKGQQQFDKKVIYCNIENRLSVKNLRGIKGLDLSPEKFKLISSYEGNILSTEQHLEQAEKALCEFPNSVLIFDSFSSLSSNAERTKSYGDGFGGLDSRKLEGEFVRRISPILPVNNSTVVGIAHVTQNIGGHGNTVKVSRAMMYQLDIRISMKKAFPNGDWMSGDKIIGQKVNAQCITSALSSPGKSCTLWLKYGDGFQDSCDIAELGIELGLIEKAGSWYTDVQSHKKAQGFESLCNLIENDKEMYDYLANEIRNVLG